MKYGLNDTVNDFELTNSKGENRSLSEGLESSKVMLVIFRGFW
jgi:peroxiredoxin